MIYGPLWKDGYSLVHVSSSDWLADEIALFLTGCINLFYGFLHHQISWLIQLSMWPHLNYFLWHITASFLSYFLGLNRFVLPLIRLQVVYSDVYMLDKEMEWKVLPPMPKPNSHIEFSWVIVNNSIIITGGTTEKHPETKRMILVGEVFQFHLDSLVSHPQSLSAKNSIGTCAISHMWFLLA